MTPGSVVPRDFGGRNVRMVERGDTPWWVLADVCRALDIANPSNVAGRLDNDEKDTLQIAEGIAGNPNVTIITEPGLYAVILQSRKPIARPLQFRVRRLLRPGHCVSEEPSKTAGTRVCPRHL